MLRAWSSKVRGNRFRGEPKKHLVGSEHQIQNATEKSWYRVSYGKYYQYYIGHYDPDKYRDQMNDYKAGKRKSRPNGRIECKLRKNRDFSTEYRGGKTWVTLKIV